MHVRVGGGGVTVMDWGGGGALCVCKCFVRVVCACVYGACVLLSGYFL
jgi:hypothetical protein